MIERASRTVNGYEGCISVVDSNGQTIWIVDAHRGDGRHKTMNLSNLFPLWRRVSEALTMKIR
jgi:hypothetical protein